MKVKFVPQNIELETTPEKTLLQLAMDNGIEIKSLCKGVPSCAECRIRITEGDSNVMPPNKTELSLIGTNYYIDSRRLACQVRCFGSVTIDMTEQLARQENNTKKIRGFRSEKPQESIAVLDTMLLTEKPSESSAQESSPSEARENETADNSPRPQGQPQQKNQKQQNQNPNQKQKQHQNQNPNQKQKQQHQNQKQQHQQKNAQNAAPKAPPKPIGPPKPIEKPTPNK